MLPTDKFGPENWIVPDNLVPPCLGVCVRTFWPHETLERITIEPDKCGGRPCIRIMRIRVTDILGMLAEGPCARLVPVMREKCCTRDLADDLAGTKLGAEDPRLWAQLTKAGAMIGPHDLIVAATALSRRWLKSLKNPWG